MNTRHFTVKGTIECYFSPSSGTYLNDIAGIEVQLWQEAPAQSVFLGKRITNSEGGYEIEFDLESPTSNIDDGKINNVFIKAYYNGELLIEKLDDDAQLYFDQLDPQPSSLYKLAINTLVIRLKYDGNWDKLDRLWIHATEHQQNATISLKNPTSTPLTEISSPAWSVKQGYTGNGTSSYLDLNYTPSTDADQFTQDSAMFAVYTRLAQSDDTSVIFGAYNSVGKQTMLALNYTGLSKLYMANGAAQKTFGNTTTKGLLSVVRTSSTNVSLWIDGSSIDVQTETSLPIDGRSFHALAWNNNGSPGNYSTNQLSITIIGSGTIDQSTLCSALQTFATSTGFNV